MWQKKTKKKMVEYAQAEQLDWVTILAKTKL